MELCALPPDVVPGIVRRARGVTLEDVSHTIVVLPTVVRARYHPAAHGN